MKSLTGICGVIATLTLACLVVGQEKDRVKKILDARVQAGLAKRHLDKMQGSWQVVSVEMADKKASEVDLFKKMKVTVKGHTLIFENVFETEGTWEGTITKLDPKTKSLDWAVTRKGMMLAIYELKGDELKIVFGKLGEDGVRPSKFTMEKGDVVNWGLILKREKP